MRTVNIRRHLDELSSALQTELNKEAKHRRNAAYAKLRGHLEVELTSSDKGLSILGKTLRWQYIQNDRAKRWSRGISDFFSGKDNKTAEHTLVCSSASRVADAVLSEEQRKDLRHFGTDETELTRAADYIRIWNVLNKGDIDTVLLELESFRTGTTQERGGNLRSTHYVEGTELRTVLHNLIRRISHLHQGESKQIRRDFKNKDPYLKKQAAHQIIHRAIKGHKDLLRLYTYHNQRIYVKNLREKVRQHPKEIHVPAEVRTETDEWEMASYGNWGALGRPPAEAYTRPLNEAEKRAQAADRKTLREAEESLENMLAENPNLETEAANTLNAKHTCHYNLSDPQNQMAMLHHHHPGEYETVLAKIAELFEYQAPEAPSASAAGAAAATRACKP